ERGSGGSLAGKRQDRHDERGGGGGGDERGREHYLTATNTTMRTDTATASATAYARRRPDWTRATSPPTWMVPEPTSSSDRSTTGSSTLRRRAFESATAGR